MDKRWVIPNPKILGYALARYARTTRSDHLPVTTHTAGNAGVALKSSIAILNTRIHAIMLFRHKHNKLEGKQIIKFLVSDNPQCLSMTDQPQKGLAITHE